MDEQLYEELIYEYLFPMMAHLYEVICVVHQDNDPTHNSKLCRDVFKKNNIKRVIYYPSLWNKLILLFKISNLQKFVAPPSSPDLNPIEMLWSEMKNFVRDKFCKTPEAVAAAIHEFQKSLTPEKCQKNINKIYEVILLKKSVKNNIYSNACDLGASPVDRNFWYAATGLVLINKCDLI